MSVTAALPPRVLITPESMLNKVSAPYVVILEQAGFEVRFASSPNMSRGLFSDAQTMAELSGIDAVIAGAESLSGAVIAASPRLRIIARCGVGYDRVDVPAATQRGIPVTITPTANHEAVAEHTLALLLAAAKLITKGDRDLRAGKWDRALTFPVRGTTLGIMGLGRIGRSLAVRGQALGMKVIACEAFPQADFVAQHGIELVDWQTLLSRSDFLSLHCPMTEQTRGLINRQSLAQMKPGATLLNTARGKLVVEADLIEALKSGHLQAAGLDVFEEEPPAPDNPLFQLPNVIATPHLAGTDWLSLQNMGIEAAENIVTLSQNRWPTGAVVNESLQAIWKW